jgi:hypothetical protein
MKKILSITIIIFYTTSLLAQPTAGLVAYWPMNGNFNDAHTNAIHGSNFSATSTTNRGNVANTAMQFVNPSGTVPQYGTHPINSNLSFGTNQDFTIDFWVFFNSPFVANGGIYDNCLNYNGYGVWFWHASGFPQIQFNFKNNSVGTTNGAITLGTWVHVTCIRATTAIRIYINGVLNNSAAPGTGIPAYPMTARFGAMGYASFTPPHYNGFNGKIDELRIYNRALTQAEINILVTLPIKLTSFTATQKNNDVQLNWQTATEINSQHFLVQRSTDGINYSTVATVNAKGNSSDYVNYTYNDINALSFATSNIVYYRLQMVDKDGKAQYSQVVKVIVNNSVTTLKLLQNPVKDNIALQVYVAQNETTAFTLTNVSGQMVFNKTYNLLSGKNFITVPVSNLSKATYYLTVHYKNGKQTTTVIKD